MGKQIEKILRKHQEHGIRYAVDEIVNLFSQQRKDILQEIVINNYDKDFGTYHFEGIARDVLNSLE